MVSIMVFYIVLAVILILLFSSINILKEYKYKIYKKENK